MELLSPSQASQSEALLSKTRNRHNKFLKGRNAKQWNGMGGQMEPSSACLPTQRLKLSRASKLIGQCDDMVVIGKEIIFRRQSKGGKVETDMSWDHPMWRCGWSGLNDVKYEWVVNCLCFIIGLPRPYLTVGEMEASRPSRIGRRYSRWSVVNPI
jgi:hypothetical protein